MDAKEITLDRIQVSEGIEMVWTRNEDADGLKESSNGQTQKLLEWKPCKPGSQ